MTVKIILWLLTLVAAPLLVARADLWRKAMRPVMTGQVARRILWWRKEGMPLELRSSTLLLNEAEISTREPVPLHGRTDQVFLTDKGKLVLVDTKTRDHFQVYESDIIQLSVYAVILGRCYAGTHRVSKTGYVRVVIVKDGRELVRYLRVRLLPERKVIALYQRHGQIVSGLRQRRCTCDGVFH